MADLAALAVYLEENDAFPTVTAEEAADYAAALRSTAGSLRQVRRLLQSPAASGASSSPAGVAVMVNSAAREVSGTLGSTGLEGLDASIES